MKLTQGFCYTFNSLSVSELFKSSEVVKTWNSNLNLKLNSNLVNPTGFGSANGFNFILNAHEPFSNHRSAKNFILSISNENNPFDIFEHNFLIEPGNFYTFKVLANQVWNLAISFNVEFCKKLDHFTHLIIFCYNPKINDVKLAALFSCFVRPK